MHNISFIIPTYNSTPFLQDSVGSVFNENFEPGDELIIVDDCSKDNTVELAYELKKKYGFIEIFTHRINKGKGIAGVNTGVENARNELIFVLDHDNLLLPGTIKLLKQFLLTNK